MEEFHSCDASTQVSSFMSEPHRIFTTKSLIPLITNRVKFEITCTTIPRDIITNEYSTYVVAEHPHEVSKFTFHHDLSRRAPDVDAMSEAIEGKLTSHRYLPVSDLEEMIDDVVDETMKAVNDTLHNNFVVSVTVLHQHDRVFFENVPRMVPATDESIGNLERKIVTDPAADCSVCMEGLEIGSVAAMMPCSHTFHGVCIQRWLNVSHHCPLCRYKMPHD